MSEDIGFGKYITKVSNLSDWLKKFTMPKTGEKYVSENVGAEFLNQDKVKGVDKVTYDKLVKKIKVYFKDNKPSGTTQDKEIDKLPLPYKNESHTQSNFFDINNDRNSKGQSLLLERHKEAKQKIAFYQSNKTANNIKASKQMLMLKKQGGRS